jgi:hypothetical protein
MNKGRERLELLASLRQILTDRFNSEELQTLCFELGIEYENLGGQGKAGKARELIGYVERRDLIIELISAGEKLRADIPWRKLPITVSAPVLSSASHISGGSEPGRSAKILFLAANPKGTSPLRLDEEIREIEHALRLAEFRDRFDLVQQWAVRVSDLQDHFLRFRPDIVHFSGHGSSTSKIILEDQAGSSHAISPRALSNLFQTLKDNIRCVVLNACYSEGQAQAIAEHIDCVVGMNKAIGDAAAISFASAFYRGIGYGRNVKTAFDLATGQIDLQGFEAQNTPQLLAFRQKPEDVNLLSDF